MTKEKNIVDLQAKLRRLDVKLGSFRFVLEHDDKMVTISTKGPFVSKVVKFDLWRFVPEPIVHSSINSDLRANLKIALVLITGAVVVYFSDYNQAIPLLAPALLVFSLPKMAVGLLSFRSEIGTVFVDAHDSEALIKIPHALGAERERQAFEESLVEAITSARIAFYSQGDE